MESEIEKVLEEQVRPMLAAHMGSASFVSFKNGVVTLRLLGACKGCPLSELTLKAGIEEILKQNLQGIKAVESV